MNLSTRKDHIVAMLRSHGAMSVDRLAGHFKVTPQTIRRDLNQLYEANLLRRRHGGAELIAPQLNQPYDTRRISNFDAKVLIGQAVASLIPDHSCILLGFGTTPEQVALALARQQRRHLTVVTNNLRVALALGQDDTHRIVMPGGELRIPNPEILGTETERLFRSFRADFGISGVGGVDPDGALLDFDRAEAACHEALRESCRTRILILDHSKFGRTAPVRSGHIRDHEILVTDSALPDGFENVMTETTRLMIPQAQGQELSA
ncbi:DeoR/GlpR family DNA-binding transcription regulator [Corticimicrobacter populi]|uniref:DeoR family transcriptional regulator n=1 Tax=Corticimicrobacter populi TaxID=2175229 RepID=A0A2V1K2W2_9BURK|nr:DeoR/GlpR family DNA-binding transcription regulator [Corticimicrobacter populi]PWF22643.1 DeoR family transcriptional regulator [Corticimicrobacter populi]